MAANITVDMREFDRRMKRLTDVALNNARIQASHDAANQTKTKASRLIGQDINLPAAKIKEKLMVKGIRGPKHTYYELRVSYKQIGAQGFKGTRFNRAPTGGRKSRATPGLTFKPYKNQPAINFPSAFTARSGNFFKRVGKPRLPIERIVGPSIHGAMEDVFPRVVEEGRAAYRRRLGYWIGREIKKL